MKILSDEIVRFFKKQHFVIVSTVNKKKIPHCACKGIVKINKGGKIYLLDLYKRRTCANLRRNPHISVTAVDEHKFRGWCLKGKAQTIGKGELSTEAMTAWENKITDRITHRLIKNMREEKGHRRHPESQLPKPEYMIVMKVEEIINLSPYHVK